MFQVSKDEGDLKYLLRTGREIADAIISLVNKKENGHRINEPAFVPPLHEGLYWRLKRSGAI